MKILMLPGDGIGPEIMEATATALDKLNKFHDLKLDFEQLSICLLYTSPSPRD